MTSDTPTRRVAATRFVVAVVVAFLVLIGWLFSLELRLNSVRNEAEKARVRAAAREELTRAQWASYRSFLATITSPNVTEDEVNQAIQDMTKDMDKFIGEMSR